ncbi:MAG: hypothetical protein ONA69_00585, partial [candidate division KSB1 bacterium]|nr:hypothetical protein [candidate division KSB1 bacterium]
GITASPKRGLRRERYRVGYGSRELENRRFNFGGDPQENTEALKNAGINAHFYVSPNTAHEWQTWRRSFYQFAQLIFKNKRRPGLQAAAPPAL